MGDDARDTGAADAVVGSCPPLEPPTDPTDPPGGSVSLDLPPHLASIGRGRRWVAADAARNGLSETGVRIAQLLTSELIANAVLHGPPGGELRVRVARSDRVFRVEVDDASAVLPRLVPATRDGGGGHGLALVDRLADRWGCDRREPRGKTVWFEVRLRRPVPGPARTTTSAPGPAAPEQAGPEPAGPEPAGPEQAGPEQAGPEQAGPEQAGPG